MHRRWLERESTPSPRVHSRSKSTKQSRSAHPSVTAPSNHSTSARVDESADQRRDRHTESDADAEPAYPVYARTRYTQEKIKSPRERTAHLSPKTSQELPISQIVPSSSSCLRSRETRDEIDFLPTNKIHASPEFSDAGRLSTPTDRSRTRFQEDGTESDDTQALNTPPRSPNTRKCSAQTKSSPSQRCRGSGPFSAKACPKSPVHQQHLFDGVYVDSVEKALAELEVMR